MDTQRVRYGSGSGKPEMTKEAKERLEDFNAEMSDWYGTCPRCGAYWQGRLLGALAHVCDG